MEHAAERFEVERPTDAEMFLAAAGGFLGGHEAENNLLFGIASSLRLTPLLYGVPAHFAVVRDAVGDVAGAALRTPPFNLVLGHGGPPEAVDALADGLAGESLPGVSGPSEAAARFASRWAAAHGTAADVRLRERIFRLTTVRPPRPTTGWMRLAVPGDRQLIVAWLVAFAAEALGEGFTDPGGAADRWIRGVGRNLYLWEDDREVVALAGVGGETPNGVRVGPVYTPPGRRSRGYASNLVAAASQAALDAGRRFVFLFTDLANPTSNRIYQAIGYEPVIDIDLWRFAPGS